jgi:hypothetical protein
LEAFRTGSLSTVAVEPTGLHAHHNCLCPKNQEFFRHLLPLKESKEENEQIEAEAEPCRARIKELF